MQATKLFLPALALGAAAILIGPAEQSQGFSVLGGTLSAENQRDFRVRNNFADPQSNNWQSPDSQFPGWQGADQALWKAAVEWGSTLHGDGSGTPGQLLGEGGANFDFAFMGRSTGAGNSNNNIVAATPNCGGNTLAFVETPISDGWRMTFCDNHVWADGPGQAVNGEFNIQGVGTHEFGHSLGLGHSTTNAIMKPATSDGNERNLEADDIAGVQFLYGVASPSKPLITDAVLCQGDLTLTGSNFSATGNQVWFTNAAVTSTGSDPRVIVSNVSSSSGGTQITVTMPANAGPGDVLVKQNATGHSTLSNAWPVNTAQDGFAAIKNGTGVNAPNFSEVTPPNIGQTWNTSIAIQPNESRTLVAISLNTQLCRSLGLFLNLLQGTELLLRTPFVKPHDVSFTGAHAIPIGANCDLVGEKFCTQGFGIELNPIRVYARNALEITIGDS